MSVHSPIAITEAAPKQSQLIENVFIPLKIVMTSRQSRELVGCEQPQRLPITKLKIANFI
ncbi:hypothetical protein FACS189472_18860 [Alphaproteobacteria bacterium]|nr:hypothetical protein FACS189472_18860 [Alphaproteobacteria bacterium]